MRVEFLELDEVLELHAAQLAEFGGGTGLRDQGLLESALAQPSATAFGELLHPDIEAMAATYLFHLVKNHPFVDGNKRVGLVAALTFLELNVIDTDAIDSDALYDLTIGIADSTLGKPAATERLRELLAHK